MDLKNEIINKSGFLIYTDYWEKYFSKMSGEQIKEVFKIIFCFNKTFEILKTDDLAVEMVVATIIDNIKRDAEKRFKQSIASKENGKMGGRPKLKHKVEITPIKPLDKPKKTQSVFIKPTIQEIKDYCLERKNNIDAEHFFNFYEARAWKDIKNWKACVITWEKNKNKFTNNNNQNKTQGVSEWKRIIS
jgi:hypothetical protein